jgi:acetyltransferase-like isoleucine patch superfamily enzyme
MFTYGEHCTTGLDGNNNPEVTIGNFTRIGKGTIFYGNSDYPSVNHPELVCNYAFAQHEGIQSFPDMGSKGPIKVGNDVWIGNDCQILSGVTIGDGSIIGVSTVVSKSIPPYAVAVGSPIVIKRFRFPQETIDKLLKIKWWNWSIEQIRERITDFLDVNKFVEKYDNTP